MYAIFASPNLQLGMEMEIKPVPWVMVGVSLIPGDLSHLEKSPETVCAHRHRCRYSRNTPEPAAAHHQLLLVINTLAKIRE
ncbi:hypothetical protein [Anabaena azotica]|uniref:Uncharacterized protein n=1 Tax=Anabaena azotica FACHB-119 TaxID=947527 RepID=A0ABR8DG08_9NOST|nr:hypothetical protein [Anabaena azotica]MBD2505556.1 hypothetical protein [Anabaena azotica FACHB-119]